MKTITIQIGNSDNKLTQNDWAHYVESAKLSIESHANEVHFFGGPPNWYPWQNVAWVIAIKDEEIPTLKQSLAYVRHSYKQDSIALLIGETEFI
jgi:hypothetical protein